MTKPIIRYIHVFYDGACPLCRREIEHYKSLPSKRPIEWVDISTQPDAFTQHGYSIERGLYALHAMDHDGYVHVGVDAFILLWAQFKHWSILSTIVGVPGVYQIASFSYRLFAGWRYKKMGYTSCSDCHV